jgi:hypothetical protein
MERAKWSQLPHADSDLPRPLLCSFVAALPCSALLQIRLDTLLRLHAIKWLCFAFLEADHHLRAPGHGCVHVCQELLRWPHDVAACLLES